MKKIFRNNRLIAVAFLTVFAGTATIACDSTKPNPVSGAELKFAGMFRNNPVFELSVNNDREEDTCTISITDMFGNVFFYDRIRAQKFSRQFLLNIEELGEDKLVFKIHTRSDNKTTLYEIGSRTQCINEATVTRLHQAGS